MSVDSNPPSPPSSGSQPSGAVASRRSSRVPGLVVAVLLGLMLGRFACQAPQVVQRSSAAGEASTWTCSMDPQVLLPEFGDCPICGMDLIPLLDEPEEGLSPSDLRVSVNAAALAGIVTAPVQRREVTREVRVVGRVTFDQTRLAHISAWVDSRLDRMFVDSVGVLVREGDHLMEVYSPDLIATQQELLAAVRGVDLLGPEAARVVRERQSASVLSARERLRLWGLTTEQIEDIIRRGSPVEQVTIYAPFGGIVVEKNALQGDHVEIGTRIYTIADLSRVWVQLDAYETDLAWLHYGQKVEFETPAYPGEIFDGRISFIDPVVHDPTRTVRVRVTVDNTGSRLKPDMFVRATVHSPVAASGLLVDPELADLFMCPMHPEVVTNTPTNCPVCGMDVVATRELGFRSAEPGEHPIVVPETAPLITGKRAVVFVKTVDDEGPVFEAREVSLGPRAAGYYLVNQGLRVGEEVVVRGAFKLDSELQIRARPSMMSKRGHPGTIGPGAPAQIRKLLGRLIDPLAQVGSHLAAGNVRATRSAGKRLVQELDSVKVDDLEEPLRSQWLSTAGVLRATAARLGASEDITDLRSTYRVTSRVAIEALRTYGWSGEGEAPNVFHCPMAFGEQGADWLARGSVVLNPYMGRTMLRCGALTHSLVREP